jgi:hemoglobin
VPSGKDILSIKESDTMHRRTRGWQWTLAVAVTIGLAGTLWAADEPAEAKTPSAQDTQLRQSLRDVINRGAEMYNAGDPAACYYLFRGALMTSRPLLESRPELQKSVETALGDADRSPDVRRRAWVLRRSLDQVRAELGGKSPAVVEVGNKTLWQRLGGEAGVKKVIDEYFAVLVEDPKVNLTRDGKIKLDDEALAHAKKMFVEWVSQQTGGPLKYTGKSMKEAHKGLGITDAEFDASVNDLVEVLKKNEVKPADIDTVKAAVEKTRKDIVEVKDEEKKKDEDKKPVDEEKKPKDKEDAKKPKEKDDEKAKDKDEEKKPKEKDDKDKEEKKSKDKDDDKKDKDADK